MAKRRFSIIGLLGILSIFAPVQAAPFNNAKVVRLVDGKEVFIDRQPARVNATAAKGQQVSTGISRTELLFDRRAIGFLGKTA